MSINAESFYDPYPIRGAGEQATLVRSSNRARQRQLDQLRAAFQQLSDGDEDQSETPVMASDHSIFNRSGEGEQIDTDALAISFMRFSVVLRDTTGLTVETKHIEYAYGLFERRIQELPSISERVLVIGLAATAFVDAGLRVHLVVDDASHLELVLKHLPALFAQLDISLARVERGDDEQARRQAYSADVTIASSRELAMDFLRDSINWPKRGNSAHRLVDRLLGRRAENHRRIMNGLPCALHVDAHLGLISNARAPMILTTDAHPMHQTEELERALELVEQLVAPEHYIYADVPAEIEFTPQGKALVDQFAEEHGGIWEVHGAADMMIASSVVVKTIIKLDQHYRIIDGQLHWLVAPALVPGLDFYGVDFISRLLEIQHQCPSSGSQEVVGRASYQHLFNRYIHLAGFSNATSMVNAELADVYALASSARGRRTTGAGGFRAANNYLLEDQARKLQCIVALLSAPAADDQVAARIVACASLAECEALADDLRSQFVSMQVVDSESELTAALGRCDASSPSVLLVAQPLLSCIPEAVWQQNSAKLELVVVYRSPDWYADALLAQFMADCDLSPTQCVQVLAADDDLFAERPPKLALKSRALFGSGSGSATGTSASTTTMLQCNAGVLRWEIAKIHKHYANEAFKVRRNLLAHDQGMQSLLSFSGKGLYE